MAARTAKRLESVQLLSSDRICQESIALFHSSTGRTHMAILSNIHAKKAVHAVAYFARTCQEDVDLHTFDRARMLKLP